MTAVATIIDPVLINVARNTESLSRNCEYGFIQQKCKAGPISLLRWNGMPTAALIEALGCDFDGLMERATGTGVPVKAPIEQRKWWLTCARFQMVAHTSDSVLEFTPEQSADRARGRLRLLARKLMEDIRGGEKIFVYSSAEFATPADASALITAFRACGGSGKLIIAGAGGWQDLRPAGDKIWWARLPTLTPMMGATSADVTAWLSLLQQIAAALPETTQPAA